MKKATLVLIIMCVYMSVNAQVTNYEMKFRYNNTDTLLDRAKIFLWNTTSTFPSYLKWENSPFCLQPLSTGNIGLFTDSIHSYTTGQNIGLIFIKVAATGFFMNDYYQSNIGMMVNDYESPNVSIVSTSQGLIMQALTDISNLTEIKVRMSDIKALFPNDITMKLLIHK